MVTSLSGPFEATSVPHFMEESGIHHPQHLIKQHIFIIT